MESTPIKLELVPIDTAEEAAPRPPAPEPAARAESALDAIEILPLERAIPINAASGKVNPFLTQAAREYAEGRVDNTLWDRALAQTNGDKTAAAAVYVRARGTALRLFARRNHRRDQKLAELPFQENLDEEALRAPDSPRSRFRYALIAAALAVPLVVGGAIFAFYQSDSAQETQVAQAPKPAAPRAPRAVKGAAEPSKSIAPSVSKPIDFVSKVQEFRDAGNWNLLVLFAVEWTRKEPNNAAAWDALRYGYSRLRQYDDAASAAKKAVMLAPDEHKLWRNLGYAQLDIDDPAAALASFEQASARNDLDSDTLQQIAMLNVRLGRPQEAKVALDRAHAANPQDASTACLRTALGQITARDAYNLMRQVKAADAQCHGRGDAINTASK
jgi:tetratricopeptide (TPR) repeat protein